MHELRPLHPRTRSRLRVIASCLWLTREPASISALVRQYLKECGRC